MGFVRRLNSRDLVNDPCNGAEVYPITATNAVYREGSGQSLETILSLLENTANRKVVDNVTSDFANNKIHISYTDSTSSDIIYDRLGDFNISSSTGNDGVKTYTLSFKKPDNTTVSKTLTVPTTLENLSEDSTHRLVTDTEKTTWNNKSDFSGNYNDLTGKPDLTPLTSISVKDSKPYDGGHGRIDTDNSYYQFIKIGYIIQLQFHIKYKSGITIPQYDSIGELLDTNVIPRGSYTGIAVYQMSDSVAGSSPSGTIENLIPFKVEKAGSDFTLQVMNTHRKEDIWGSIMYIATNDNLLSNS